MALLPLRPVAPRQPRSVEAAHLRWLAKPRPLGEGSQQRVLADAGNDAIVLKVARAKGLLEADADALATTQLFRRMRARFGQVIPELVRLDPGVVAAQRVEGLSLQALSPQAQAVAKAQFRALLDEAKRAFPTHRFDGNSNNLFFDARGNVLSWFDPRVGGARPMEAAQALLWAAVRTDAPLETTGALSRSGGLYFQPARRGPDRGVLIANLARESAHLVREDFWSALQAPAPRALGAGPWLDALGAPKSSRRGGAQAFENGRLEIRGGTVRRSLAPGALRAMRAIHEARGDSSGLGPLTRLGEGFGRWHHVPTGEDALWVAGPRGAFELPHPLSKAYVSRALAGSHNAPAFRRLGLPVAPAVRKGGVLSQRFERGTLESSVLSPGAPRMHLTGVDGP